MSVERHRLEIQILNRCCVELNRTCVIAFPFSAMCEYIYRLLCILSVIDGAAPLLLFIFIFRFPDFCCCRTGRFSFCLFVDWWAVVPPPFDWQTEEAAGRHVSTQNRLKLKTRFWTFNWELVGVGASRWVEPTH